MLDNDKALHFMPKRTHYFIGSLLGGLALLALALWGVQSLSSASVYAQEQKQGDVVVQLDDHALHVRSITFTGSISGLKALALTGLDVITSDTKFGAQVCSIAGVGCPATDCFCNPQKFWAYSYWDGSAWQEYQVGASGSVISRTGSGPSFKDRSGSRVTPPRVWSSWPSASSPAAGSAKCRRWTTDRVPTTRRRMVPPACCICR